MLLPEYLQYRGSDDGFRASARPIPGPHTEPFSEVARRHGAWILVGSTAETSADPARPYNTSALIAPDGSVAAVYRKVHLFDVAVEAGPVDTESARVTAGDGLVTADVDGAIVGLSICYDLRFPELYRALALAGAQILTVPSAFTARTGRDHWEVLLRARAIENAAYVLAPSQIGGPPGQTAYGHSVVIDPWGTVVAQAPDVVGIVRAETRPRAGRVDPAPDPGPRQPAAGRLRIRRTGARPLDRKQKREPRCRGSPRSLPPWAGYLMSWTPSWLDVLGVTAPGLIVPGPGSAATHQPLKQPLAPLPLTNGAPGGLSHCLRSLPLMYAQSNLKLANDGMWYQVLVPVPI